MFYREEEIKNQLVCPRCKEKFDDPRILPCGHTLCQICLNEMGYLEKFKCRFCHDFHQVPKNGFPVNKTVLNLTRMKSEEVYRGEKVKNLNEILNELIQKSDQLAYKIKDPNCDLAEKCQLVRNKIDLTCENFIQQVNNHRDMLLEQLNDYEKAVSTSNMLDDRFSEVRDLLKQAETFHSDISRSLKGYVREDYEIDTKIKEATEMMDVMNKELLRIKSIQFGGTEPTFFPKEITEDLPQFGSLYFNVFDQLEYQKNSKRKLEDLTKNGGRQKSLDHSESSDSVCFTSLRQQANTEERRDDIPEWRRAANEGFQNFLRGCDHFGRNTERFFRNFSANHSR